MNDLSAHSLDAVNRELNATLEAARTQLEEYVDARAGSEALLRSADLLHLARGALKIVEIQGGALLAEEMEHTCRRLSEREDTDEARLDYGIEVLTRAMVQLPAYVDRVLGGGKDVALVLLPLLNELRKIHAKAPFSEGMLLGLDMGKRPEPPASHEAPDPEVAGREFRRVAHKLRPAFQAALLGWIKEEQTERNLDALIKISATLQQAATVEQVRQLWDVLGGVLIALRTRALEADVSLKRLVGQADRQLKRLIDGGEAALVTVPPTELLNNLLYHVARADGDHERLATLREAYGLSDIVPGMEQLEQAREDLAGPSVKLMRTVAQAIKEDLGAVKDVLDIFVRTGMENVEQLAPQLDMLKKISDTLGVLGLEKARDQIQTEARELNAMLAGDAGVDPSVLEKAAATLLDVEEALDRELVRAVAPLGDESSPELEAEEQYVQVTQAVTGECIVNLARIKESVVSLVDDPGNVRALDQVKPQLRGICAGLLMLDKTKAVNVVERIGAVIAQRLVPSEKPLRSEHLERLADAIVSVEYYMETLSSGRAEPWYMLDNAERCLDLLEKLPQPLPRRGEAAAAKRREPAPAAPAAVMEADKERSDPELLELFIEEAREEIAVIQSALPAWTENTTDAASLAKLRRSFHTLKGSGRTVGAQRVGRFAWAIENLLNRIISQTLEPTPEIIACVNDAAAALPQLIEQLEAGIAPRADVDGLIQRAEALAEPDAGSGEAEAQQAARAGEMDPVLAEIFGKEMRGHLQVIRDYLSAADVHGEAPVVEEPLYRASHTLLGSARMADYRPALALATPLSRHLGHHFESGSRPTAEGVVALRAAADEIERMAEALSSRAEYGEDLAVVAQLEALEKQAPRGDVAVEAAPAGEAELAEASYDPEIAAIFTEEAAEILENAEAALQGLRDKDNTQERLIELQRLLHTLKGGARMAGVTAMGDLSHSLETLLASMGAGSVDTGEDAVEVLQQCLDRLHQMRDAIEAGRAVSPDAPLLKRIEALSRGDTPQEAPAAPPPATADAAQSDAAPPTVFERAAEAVKAARGQATRDEHRAARASDEATPEIAQPPEQTEEQTQPQLVVVNRATVEQGDDTSGVGTLAEDEAARSAESQAASQAEAAAETPVAQAQTVASDEHAPAEVDAAPMEPRLEAMRESEAVSPEAAPALGATRLEPAEAGEVEREAAGGAEDEAEAAEEAEPEAAEPETARPVAAARERRTAERADMARVDAALLDSLLNGAGEISIFQSRLNQQIHSVEFHLGELAQTVTRLREQLRKLEAETEAQILHRHQEDSAEQDFDPLELDRYSTIQQLSRALAETANDVASINDLLRGLTAETDTLLTQQSRVTTELQDGLMQTRMVPFQRHVSRLARIVRQASADTGKPAELVVEGAGNELDRQVLEAMLPPFEHLLRNAVVHGIEEPSVRAKRAKPASGKVIVKLRRDGAEVLIEVTDDGGGLNLDAIRAKACEQGLINNPRDVSDEEARELILRPGFSTAGELTLAAGRGVGMDVVDSEIKKLGGSMRIDSTPGDGTTFRIRLPYTLAITQALIVNVGEETFALPLPTVEGVTRVPRQRLLELLTEDEPKLEYGGSSYRLQHLGSFVGAPPSALPEEDAAVPLVLVRAGEHSTALLTDRLEGNREIVVKTLGPHLGSVPGISGATILGDGRIIVILDAATLVRTQHADAQPPPVSSSPSRQVTALVVDDSITMRRVTQRMLERRGVRVITARDGLDAITVLQDQEPDVILLDIEMPRMDGYQFATHVRNDAKLADVPIIMITSRSGAKHRAKAIEIGVNDYLSKPYQESHLVGAIEALLNRSL